MTTFEIHHGDCLDVLRSMPDCSVDSVVTDPPYGLSFMGRKWDYDVPSIEIWAECLRVLKPGGHLLAFAGTRTQHRMCCRIEDAGFEIRDMIAWVYGSGFPKSLDVGKAIDSRGGYPQMAATIGREIKKARESRGLSVGECDRKFCGGTTNWSWFEGRPAGQRAPTPSTFTAIAEEWPELSHLASLVRAAEREVVGRKTAGIANPDDTERHTVGGSRSVEVDITAPATAAAKQWHGWGTALKPALEPITVARKPLIGTVAENVLTHGTGAINVDQCRVATEERGERNHNGSVYDGVAEGYKRPGKSSYTHKTDWSMPQLGRWPANLIHDGSEEVLAGFPADRPGATSNGRKGARGACYGEYGAMPQMPGRGDSGSAARFFYCPKASKSDRDEGCEEFELRVAGGMEGRNDGSLGSVTKSRNTHPTVKPTDLMRYLCRLVTPPGGTVLDPFTGSGSTGKAAILEGFRFIGIEREAEYVEIAKARIAAADQTPLLSATHG